MEPAPKEILDALHARLNAPKKRYREQTGTVVKRTDGFYLRYYADRDGVRTKVTEFLAPLDTHEKLLPSMQRSLISKVNLDRHNTLMARAVVPAAPPLTIGDFWTKTYRPWVEANKRFSTLRGYEYDWKLYVKEHLAHRTFTEFKTPDAVAVLDYCASVKKLSRRSLAHVKSLCSGIFSHATRKGIIEVNPWREAQATVKVRKATPRIEYTPEETINILNAIRETRAKLFFGLCSVLGMRPSEVAALRWENVGDGVVHVCEAAPYGKLGELKTERSLRDLTITEPVTSLLKQYRKDNSTGLLFTHDGAKPINHNTFAKTHITPFAKKVCSRWNGCYSGRHGAATTLYNLTGDVRAAYQVLGNSLAVVQKEYIKPSVEQGQAGQLAMEKALKRVAKKARNK